VFDEIGSRLNILKSKLAAADATIAKKSLTSSKIKTYAPAAEGIEHVEKTIGGGGSPKGALAELEKAEAAMKALEESLKTTGFKLGKQSNP